MATSREISQTASPSATHRRLPVRWFEDDFTAFEPPKFTYEPCRWATARTKNVEEIAKFWSDDPALAYVFNDSKLRGNELVMLRKELLDWIVTPLLELYRGRAAIRVDIDIIAASVEALRHSLNGLISCLDPNVNTATEAANAALATARAIEVQIHKISASVVVSSPKEAGIASLTEDEGALARELLAEEESDSD